VDLKDIGCEGLLDSSDSGQGPDARSCECSGEPLGYTKGGEFID
jgi:hypothetical protein